MWKNLVDSFDDVLIDSIIDSLKVLIVVLIINILLSFVEGKIAQKINKNTKLAPLYGSLVGLIPQCGISVVASDLYLKKHITVGTLIAVFIACSDEAMPIILASGNKNALAVIPLVLIKLIVGFIAGFIIDFLLSKNKLAVKQHIETCDDSDKEVHIGCCNHQIDNEHQNRWEQHLLHPILHSLKLFAYVLIFNLMFGCLVALITEDSLTVFLQTNKYISPLLCVLIGLIPNCASSVILSEMFILGGLSFGATLAGLCVNAGLGLLFLFKSKTNIKTNIYILLTLIGISTFVGYTTCLIIGF